LGRRQSYYFKFILNHKEFLNLCLLCFKQSSNTSVEGHHKTECLTVELAANIQYLILSMVNLFIIQLIKRLNMLIFRSILKLINNGNYWFLPIVKFLSYLWYLFITTVQNVSLNHLWRQIFQLNVRCWVFTFYR
jgi:hypothetical protein